MKKKASNKTDKKRLATLLIILAAALLSFFIVIAKREEIATSLAIKYYGGNSQCVGYIQRYYNNMFDIRIENVGRAQNLFSIAGNFGLYTHENGGNIAPQPGDILVFGSRNRIGHVAIITEVLKDGVKIIEQNWGTTAITINGNRPLRMDTSGGKFFIDNRDDYWVIGWASRISKNPSNFFLFPNGWPEGWYPDAHVLMKSENPDGLNVRVVGRSPIIGSPVFIAGNSIRNLKKIEMRFKIENKSGQKGSGHLFLRDQYDNWSEDVPFDIDVNKDFRVYSVNLSDLPNDFEITQLRLQLNDNPQIRNESWTINWIQIY